MRKILYISGTRADYGLIKSVLKQISAHPKLKLEIVATGMHLMEEFGYTIEEIKKDKYILHIIDSVYESDKPESMAIFLGDFIKKLVIKVKEIKPDIILLLGDRAEMLGGAIIGAYLSIPTAHLHGGEITSTVDDFARHAITKLTPIHLPATKNSAERIKNMNEEVWRINIVGAPGLDQIFEEKPIQKEELFNKLNLTNEDTILVIQHPVTLEVEQAGKQIKETLEAVKELGYQTVIIYPNADAGGREIIDVIQEYKKELKFRIFKNVPHNEYLSLLRYVCVMIGNSSGGIIEAASFKLPVVNIGTRQQGRERGANVIDVNYNKEEIKQAIKMCISPDFQKKLINLNNLYGNGDTGQKVVDILSKIMINTELLQKKQK